MPQQELSISVGAAPGMRRSASSTFGAVPNAFWWQWPCTRIDRSAGTNVGRSGRRRLANDELLEQQRLRADRRRRGRRGSITWISSRSVRRHDGSRPTIGDAALGEGQQRGEQLAARARAASAMPAASRVPAAAERAAVLVARDVHRVARGLQQRAPRRPRFRSRSCR
jgi:hypothetical protein